MAVVINEFEVVAEDRRSAPAGGAAETPREAGTAKAPEPSAVAAALRILEEQALRVWAH